jgi:transcription elongation factor Elf1
MPIKLLELEVCQMFEDETIGFACPQCGFKNSLLVRQFEQTSETMIVCQGCRVGIKVEASEFQRRLNQISIEVETMSFEARQARTKSLNRIRKGDFQI